MNLKSWKQTCAALVAAVMVSGLGCSSGSSSTSNAPPADPAAASEGQQVVALKPELKDMPAAGTVAQSEADANSSSSESADIVDTAIAAGKFQTLAAALGAAGLVETLKGAGPFTVFAPTDEAFAKLPEGTVEELLKPENKDRLISILTYHVVPQQVDAVAAAELTSAPTVNGASLQISATDDGVKVGEAKVVTADVMCSNGIIHIIDAVLLPPSATADATPHDSAPLEVEGVGSFATLFAAIEAAGLMDTLKETGPFTIFAPTDEAFAALPAGTVEDLLKAENKDKLTSILTYHVVAGRVAAADVIKLTSAATVNGAELAIEVIDGKVRVGDANVLKTDVPCDIGLIHAIDKVLIP